MLKNIIAPIQAWLLSRNQCVGCGTPLSGGSRSSAKTKSQQRVTCKCGRIFIYDKASKKYRRALFEEV